MRPCLCCEFAYCSTLYCKIAQNFHLPLSQLFSSLPLCDDLLTKSLTISANVFKCALPGLKTTSMTRIQQVILYLQFSSDVQSGMVLYTQGKLWNAHLQCHFCCTGVPSLQVWYQRM